MNKRIIVISGKKQAGKDSLAKFCFANYINNQLGEKRYILDYNNKATWLVDTLTDDEIDTDIPNDKYINLCNKYSVRILHFADYLKNICINMFGLHTIQVYGHDESKNSYTDVRWENMPEEIRENHLKRTRGTGEIKPASGFMTAREVMEVLGTEVFRKIDPVCHARATYNIIENNDYQLNIIADGRFPNEISMGTERGGIAIRLLRQPFESTAIAETALDDFPLGEYSMVIDNRNMAIEEAHKEFYNKFGYMLR